MLAARMGRGEAKPADVGKSTIRDGADALVESDADGTVVLGLPQGVVGKWAWFAALAVFACAFALAFGLAFALALVSAPASVLSLVEYG